MGPRTFLSELQGISEKSSEASVNDLLTPKRIFFTSGTGRHKDELVSFELALRDAGIEKYNLVTVSSIYPPRCEVIDVNEGINLLNPGQIVFCVMAKKTSNEEGREIFASIGAAIPENPSLNGYLSEYMGYCNGEDVGRYSEEMAACMLESAFGVKPVKTFNITEKAVVKDFTTVIAAAVLVL
ncbi:MAG TPA: arginine decarboxylase, pyruvoyl-dependent [Archaeoglobaceae archaeon]|nr:arginine decarboxylase, pyruvoyl-dependent [Archaeoglobaceae archaeon]